MNFTCGFTADKANSGDRCNRVSEMGKEEKISMSMMSHRCRAKQRGESLELVLPKEL